VDLVVVMDVGTAPILQDMIEEMWYWQKNYLNLTQIKKMDPDKMHERVLEIQKNISVATPEQQTAMLGELLEIASKVEQSLSDIKIDIDED
jgi:hypothetical protein